MLGIFGSFSGAGSVVSAHNVCHLLCLAAVGVLSLFGIAASSTLLMFLEDYNLIFWSMGMIFLGLSLVLYLIRPKCISRKLMTLNAGFLIIGLPLPALAYNPILLFAGGAIVLFVVFSYLHEKFLVKK